MAGDRGQQPLDKHHNDGRDARSGHGSRVLGLEGHGDGQTVSPGLDRRAGSAPPSSSATPSSVNSSSRDLPSVSEYVRREFARPPSPFLSTAAMDNLRISDTNPRSNEQQNGSSRRNATETATSGIGNLYYFIICFLFSVFSRRRRESECSHVCWPVPVRLASKYSSKFSPLIHVASSSTF